jgi:hypothetical protein
VEKCCEPVGNRIEHIGNIKIPLYDGLVSLHFRESKALVTNSRTCENVAYNQPTNQAQLSHVVVLVLHRGKCVPYIFNPMGHISQHTKMKRKMNLPMMNTLSQLNTQGQAIATQWKGHVFVMGLTSPALGMPLTMQVPSL